MKKNLLLTFLVISVLFTACQKKAAESLDETTAAVETTEAEITVEEMTTSTQTAETENPAITDTKAETETGTQASDDGTHEIEGVVVDAAMHSIIIETSVGEILNLILEQYEVISRDGLAIDDKVRITYQHNQVIKIVEIQ